MTILTHQAQKQDEKIVDPVTGAVIAEQKVPLPDEGAAPPAYVEVPLQFSQPSADELRFYLAARRRRFLTTFCAALLILWLLLAAVIGGLLLFRYFNRRPYYGFCGTDVALGRGEDGSKARREYLKQTLEIGNDYEKIEVPKFGFARPAIFVHDFKQNLTAIVDLKADRCFIKPLDRDRISPPQSFIDLIRKMEEGYYEQNSDVIRLQYVAHMPPLSTQQLRALGSFMIEQQCARMTTYMLERVDGGATPAKSSSGSNSRELVDTRRKRDAGTEEAFVQFIPQKKALYHYEIRFKE